jgi:plastocyanin
VQIAYRSVAIAPAKLTVKVGSTISWTNHDSIEHNVTSQSGPEKFASANLRGGGTFQIKAEKPGVINYECSLHPASMTGVIEVVS